MKINRVKAAALAAVLAGIAGGVTAGSVQYATVAHNVPGMVAKAQVLGRHDPAEVLTVSVALKLRNTDQLHAFLRDVQDPRSPSYHHWLTPAQFGALYGATQEQADAVTRYLTSQGLTVKDVTPSRLRVHVSASAGALEKAFHVSINDYRYNGRQFFSADGDPRLPAEMTSYVVSVMGLDNAVELKPHLVAAPNTAQPMTGRGINNPAGFSPQQIATAYSWGDLTDASRASGVKLAVATAFTYRKADITFFWSHFGLPSHTLTNIPIDGTTRRLNDETTLDVERSSSMGPGADVLVYESVNPSFVVFDDMFTQIINDNIADVITTSWGLCEVDQVDEGVGFSIIAEDASYLQGLAQGQTFMAAAGDGGSQDRCGHNFFPNNNADFPASDPNVISAGGTHLVLNSDNTIKSESVWVSGGGADSGLFAEPSYQTNTGGWLSNTDCVDDGNHIGNALGTSLGIAPSVACVATGDASRQGADLSLDSDPATGYALYYNGRWAVFGGTSFAAPEFAGLFSMIVKANGGHLTGRVGSGPRFIYCDAVNNALTDFNDIVVGNNGKFDALTGWDHATGWGTPIATSFITNGVAALGACIL